MSHFDCIILGGGGMGSATAYQLTKRGHRVLLLEQFAAAHDRGSSHGETRVIRKAYFEHPDYVPLLRRAYQLWSELEEVCGKRLYYQTGLLLAGPTNGEVIVGAQLASATHAVPLDHLTESDLQSFPGFQIPEELTVLLEPEAGYLLVEQCVSEYLQAATRAGCEVHTNERVLHWSSDDRGVAVQTTRAHYQASSLVITAGAWSASFLPAAVPLRVLRKALAWHQIRAESEHTYINGPVFLFQMNHGAFYGFPSIDGATVKVAEHSGGDLIDHPQMLDRQWTPCDTEPVSAFVRQVMPGLNHTASRGSICMYTMTPDEHFIVDEHPQYSNVHVAAGFSGHGYKFASVIGEILADRVEGVTTVVEADFLRLQGRFR